MRKIYLFMLTLLLCSVALAQPTSGKVYTLGVDAALNGGFKRGYLCASDNSSYTDWPVLSDIKWNIYASKSATPITQAEVLVGNYWYFKANKNNSAFYIYNIGKGKFLSGGADKASFSDTPYPWYVSSNGSYKNIKDILKSSGNVYLNCACGTAPASKPIGVYTADDDGSKFTFTEVSGGFDTYSSTISTADAAISNYETSMIKTDLSPSSWTSTTAYPERLITLSGHLDNSGHSAYKMERMVAFSASSTATATFAFSGGSHALSILGVDLVDANGNVVKSDYHVGQVGNSYVNHVYTLSSVPVGTYLLRVYVCDLYDNHEVSQFNGSVLFNNIVDATQEQMNAYFATLKSAASSKYTACNSETNNGKLGYYTQASLDALSSANTSATAVSGDVTLGNITSLTDGVTGLRVVCPTPGKFYRFKSKLGRYINAKSNGANFAMTKLTESSWDHASVFYLTIDNKFLNFKSGTYIKNTHTQGNVGDDGNVIYFFASEGGNLSYFTLMSNYTGGGQYLYDNATKLDRNGSYAAAGNCDWTVEEVTWLPVPMNKTVGYATLFSPIQLSLSDRVEAYAASEVTSSSVKLQSLDNIPANVGVILKLVDNSAVDTRNCVFLEVTGSGATAESKLAGTLASTKVSNDAYVLAKREENVGFYKAAKNQDTDTKWINNGFKAYLLASLVTESGTGEARVLTFDFDDNAETGINAVEIEEAAPANAAIYDLSGRRVQSAKSGLYIINGKKVIK